MVVRETPDSVASSPRHWRRNLPCQPSMRLCLAHRKQRCRHAQYTLLLTRSGGRRRKTNTLKVQHLVAPKTEISAFVETLLSGWATLRLPAVNGRIPPFGTASTKSLIHTVLLFEIGASFGRYHPGQTATDALSSGQTHRFYSSKQLIKPPSASGRYQVPLAAEARPTPT